MGWVYAIVDNDSGKAYIGQTSRPPQWRWSDHRRSASKGRRHPLYSAMAIRPEAFEFLVLAEAENDEAVSALERDLIALGNTLHPHGYNLQGGGLRSYRKSEAAKARQRGKRASAETRRKLSESHKGHKRTPEALAKFRATMTGRKQAPEVVEARRLSQLGRKMPQAQIEFLRKVNTGRKASPETIAKMRAAHAEPECKARNAVAHRGKRASAETKERMSAAHRTPEAIARASAVWLGKTFSDQHRQRMSEGLLLRSEMKRQSLPSEKACTSCKAVLPSTTEFFSPDKRAITGLYPACKGCRRAANRAATAAKKLNG